MELVANFKDVSINTIVKLKKIKSIKLIQVKHKDKNGLVVRLTAIKNKIPISFNRGYINSDGKLVSKTDIIHFITKNGKDIRIKPFEYTKKIEIAGLTSKYNYNQFLVSNYYEIYSDNINAVFKIAKHLYEDKKMGLAKFSFGKGFRQYLGLIYPVFVKDRFVLVMALSESRIEYKCLMDLNKKEIKFEELPTLSEAIELPMLIAEKKKIKVN